MGHHDEARVYADRAIAAGVGAPLPPGMSGQVPVVEVPLVADVPLDPPEPHAPVEPDAEVEIDAEAEVEPDPEGGPGEPPAS
jgi:hypothetical protein